MDKFYSPDFFIYADDHLLVINKPSGLLSIPDGYDISKPYVQQVLEKDYGRIWVVHRLDKETSGVMVLARNQAAHRSLSLQFENHTIQKTYHALVHGSPEWEEISNEAPLRSGVGHRNRTIVDYQSGKAALTEFKVLRRFTSSCLVSARPWSGRTHQIRVHLYNLGFPILNDHLYGKETAKISSGISRLGLHAYSINLIHPYGNQQTTYQAAYPEDFSAAIRYMSTSDNL